MQVLKMQAIEPGSLPAYLSNGLIGLRVGPIPLVGGTALVNGYCGLSKDTSSEEYAQAPYPLGTDIEINGTKLSLRPDLAEFRGQEYDLSCGELRSRFDFRVGEHIAHIEVVTFCSRTQPTLVLQEAIVTVDSACDLVLYAYIDPEAIDGRLIERCMPERGCDGILWWESRGGLGTLGAAYRSELQGDEGAAHRRTNFGPEKGILLTRYSITATQGGQYVLRQIASLVPGCLQSEPHWHASRMAGMGSWHGFDELRRANREAWTEIWKGRPVILGADAEWQEITDAAYFYLHSTINNMLPCSVAPYGLSRKEYHGHVFWDTDSFMFPPVLLTAPKAARAMLDYRSDRVRQARDNAALSGYAGLQFPWQSGMTGSEVSPFWTGAQGGAAEQHINLEVAFAFAQYVHATGDEMFLKQQAWPVLEGVAEWIVSRTTKTDRGYEIRHITGPDEFLDDVHNNSFTNMTAIVVLREAIGFARCLGLTPPAAWSKVADGMFIPIDPGSRIIQKHDAYEYTGGMCMPEPLIGYFPFNYKHSPEVDQATSRYYLDLAETCHGLPAHVGPVLSGVIAARNGERDLARRFFDGFKGFVVEPYHQLNECFTGHYGNPTSTIFTTNAGTFLLTLMIGLTGLELDGGAPEEWAKFPVIMPEGWEGIEIERIWVRGEPATLRAMHGDERATITPIR